ncbi:MAG: hypothetical protein OHK0039_22130 [Bacteroidia bacterium]
MPTSTPDPALTADLATLADYAAAYLPYDPFRLDLYTWQELMEGYREGDDQSRDLLIYRHFSARRHRPSMREALCQRIHDHAIDEGLRRLIGFDDRGMTSRACIGIMGGHGKKRGETCYIQTAQTAWLLARAGYYVVSGGGPGIMEAANLGAYFARYEAADLHDAIEHLRQAPVYTDPGYLDRAREVLDRYPQGSDSLAIPTWFYGHEPSNLFASHIAKYFSNSIREDTLLAISLHGVLFAPGSAGTTQEIFQDAAQNHYGTYGYYSPMVFLGRERYEIQTSLYPLLKQLAWGKPYYDLLHLSDRPEEIRDFFLQHPPSPVPQK